MQTRTLGPSKIPVSALGLGCMGMSDFYGPRNDAQSIATMHRAVDLGVTLFDTADMYGPYTNERLVGDALKPHRDRVLIATKFGIVRDLVDPAKRTISGRPEYVRTSCDGSLQRLGVDHIDLYYQHRVDQNTPIEETVGAMADLVVAGKVRLLGLSEAGSDTIRRAHKVHPIAALQSEYSLWSRDIEGDIIGTCRELGITIVPYSPLGRGFLTGAIRRFEDLADDDFRRRSPRFQGENFAKNLALVDAVAAMAKEKGCTSSATRARVGARAGRRHGPHPRHAQHRSARGEPRGRRHHPLRGRPCAAGGDRAERPRRRRTLRRRRHEVRRKVRPIACQASTLTS